MKIYNGKVNLESKNQIEFMDITDMDYLQILAVLINQNIEGNSVRNITDRYLNEIKTEQIIGIWDKAKKAILKTQGKGIELYSVGFEDRKNLQKIVCCSCSWL